MTLREFVDRLQGILDKHPWAGKYLVHPSRTPVDFDRRIGNFIAMCHELGGTVIVARPEECGAFVESLSRLGTSVGVFIARSDEV